MNITILHNAYQQAGGEDVVVKAEVELLIDAGHNVHLEEVSNFAIRSPLDKVGTFLRAPYDSSRRNWALELFTHTQPDIVHVHNFFPLLTLAVHDAARQYGAGVVQTLHNYRVICAAATLLREGKPCEACIGGSRHWGVLHRCYRGSIGGSLAVTRMQERIHRRPDTWQRHVDCFIALTEFARAKFAAAGLPAERIVVKPNFASTRQQQNHARNGGLYVGRLAPEKGVGTLLAAWSSLPDVPLTIVGDGPEREALTAAAPPNVRFLGSLPSAGVAELMDRSAFLIVPSHWYEGFPMVVVEAFAAGLPVLASQLGALAEIVSDGINGRHFLPSDGSSLAGTVRETLREPGLLVRLGEGARQTFAARYTPADNLKQLEAIYSRALLARAS